MTEVAYGVQMGFFFKYTKAFQYEKMSMPMRAIEAGPPAQHTEKYLTDGREFCLS